MSLKDLMQTGKLAPSPTPRSTTVTGPISAVGAIRADIPVAPRVQPVRTSPEQVIFRCHRPTFGFIYQGKRKAFSFGFLMTDDVALIEHIKSNFVPSMVAIVEFGPLTVRAKPTVGVDPAPEAD